MPWKEHQKAFRAVRLLFVGIALLNARIGLAQQYTVTDLGTFDGILRRKEAAV
jgi:hypothetical protein